MNRNTLIVTLSCFFLSVSHTQSMARQDSLTNITTVEYAYPFWSPSGEEIVCQSNLYGNWDIFVMKADGSGRRRLTSGGSNNITPTVSPDGKRVAFISDRDGDNDIYFMNMEGLITDKLTHNEVRDYHPAWSPDGTKITYGSGPTEAETEIYEMDLQSRQVRKLTENNHFDSFSNYAPDGKSIVWIKWLPENNGELFILDLETGNERRLTDTRIFEGYPVWSKNGRYVYYAFPNQETRRYDISKVNVGTLEVETVFQSMMHDARPQESPDGGRLAFNRQDENGIFIHIMTLE